MLNNLMMLAVVVLFPSVGSVTGPYWLIFSLLVQYYSEVPSTYRFRLFGLQAGDKLLAYLLSIQLVGNQFPASLFAAMSGILSGLIYKSDVLSIKRLTLPPTLVRIAQRWLLPILQQAPRHTPININMLRPQQQPQGAGARLPRTEAPPESAVAALMDMGFSREEAYGALTHANNDPQLAAALLLDQH